MSILPQRISSRMAASRPCNVIGYMRPPMRRRTRPIEGDNPNAAQAWIEPDGVRVDAGDALEPCCAGLVVHVLDGAADVGDLVGAHRGVADEDDLVVGGIGVQHLPGRVFSVQRRALSRQTSSYRQLWK